MSCVLNWLAEAKPTHRFYRKQKEESARLLCLLIGASTSLIKPYAPPMLSVLLKTASAKDSSPAVTSYCLACLGELARVGGEEIAPSVDRIMALIMEMLADQTSTLTRDAALKALGQVASNTGMVIEPYQKYPQLLGLLIRFLKTEKNQTIRRETIRTMGILGALDPYKHRVSLVCRSIQSIADMTNQMLHDTTADPDADQSGAKVTDVMLLMNSSGTSPDEFYQRVAINALVQVLHDPTNTTHHWAAVEALMLIFKTQGLKCVSYLPQVRNQASL
jgi:FKBP12-rapamycin complex-associated protein